MKVMIQLALVAVSIGLIILGFKGFTPSGLAFSKKTTLRGTSGMVVGVICILLGLALIPGVFLIFWLSSQRT